MSTQLEDEDGADEEDDDLDGTEEDKLDTLPGSAPRDFFKNYYYYSDCDILLSLLFRL